MVLATCALALVEGCSKADDLSPLTAQPRQQAQAIQASIGSARASVSAPRLAPSDPMAGPTTAMPLAATVAPTVALPAFPGSAHLYHLGSRNFFLDAADALSLSSDQRGRLSVLSQTSTLDRAETRRRIEGAERHLWTLTAADAPDLGMIEADVREIERLRADDRLAFIRAVGDGAHLLTAAQRAMLISELRSSVDAGAPPADVIPDADAGMRPM